MSRPRRYPLSDAEMRAALVDPRNLARWQRRASRGTFVAPTGCLIRGKWANEYSQFRVFVGDRVLLVGQHRFALMLKLGRPLRAGMQALHSCDHGACISDNHLWEGSQLDNMRDASSKGRLSNGWGATRAELFVDLSPRMVSFRREMAELFNPSEAR